MKLLFCMECFDVFKLDMDEERACKCGKVTGKYIDPHNAVTNGKGVSIAIGNGSLINAARACRWHEKWHDHHNKQLFIDEARISHAWVRPNEGPGNPHTKVKI